MPIEKHSKDQRSRIYQIGNVLTGGGRSTLRVPFLLSASVRHLNLPHKFLILFCLEIQSCQSPLNGKCIIWNINLPYVKRSSGFENSMWK